MRTSSKDTRVRALKALLEIGYEYEAAHQLAVYNIREALDIINQYKREKEEHDTNFWLNFYQGAETEQKMRLARAKLRMLGYDFDDKDYHSQIEVHGVRQEAL